MKLQVARKIIRKSQTGFTIVELMIALSVLSILLLLSALTLINLGKIYVKGNNQANAQNIARNIIGDLSSQLQLGGATPIINIDSPNSGSFCIGTTRYDYIVGRQVDGRSASATQHALWRDTMTSSGACPTLASMQSNTPHDSLSNKDSNGNFIGTELIPANVRLTNFNVTPVSQQSGVYKISVGVAYGDDDLLCVRGVANDCNSSWIAQNTATHENDLENVTSNQTVGCVVDIGQQFCAASNLSVTVARRLASE